MRVKITTRNGEIVSGRGNLKDAFASLKDGDHAVEIKDWDRTLEQNSLYWKWLTIIGEHLGYTKEELHEVMLQEFAPVMTFRDLKGKPQQRKVRSSEMSVKEMSEYMNHIDRFAAQENVRLPIPDEQA